ncbi:MAG: hypothetical protein IKL68_06000 [Clostridia bacterium]|nr:hypothetical protein [Clostridia bacterium]
MIEFFVFFAIGFIAFTLYKFGIAPLFRNKPIKEDFQEKVEIFSYDFKVFKLRKEYAETHNIGYTTPFEFKYYDDKFRIETESMTQLDFLNKLTNLEHRIEPMISSLDENYKTTEPGLSYVNVFYSLKEQLREANPYVS